MKKRIWIPVGVALAAVVTAVGLLLYTYGMFPSMSLYRIQDFEDYEDDFTVIAQAVQAYGQTHQIVDALAEVSPDCIVFDGEEMPLNDAQKQSLARVCEAGHSDFSVNLIRCGSDRVAFAGELKPYQLVYVFEGKRPKYSFGVDVDKINDHWYHVCS